MAQQTVNNGDSGLSARNKINGNFTELYTGGPFTAPVKLPTYTVATLPAVGTIGRIAVVTDALAPTFLATIAGGGTAKCIVLDNGTNWVAA